MSRLKLDRRAFLRGTGGVAVGLPFLEIMVDGKAAQAASPPPLRYLVTFAGLAVATDAASCPYVVPAQFGMNYLTGLKTTPANATSPNVHGLSPLATLNLAGEVTLVSNLHIPRATGPANWNTRWHPPTVRPLFSGMSSTDKNVEISTPTSDIMAVDVIGKGARFAHLALRGQPVKYRFNDQDPNLARAGGRLSADAQGAIEPFVDPGQVYDQLFGTAPPDQAQAAAKEDRAVVDVVLARAQRLRARLGTQDQKRLDQHLQELRDLEMRIGGLVTTPACTVPPKPMTSFPSDMTARSGWSNETLRFQLMNDLIYLAFACDLTRAASLLYTYASSFVAVSNILGRNVTGDIHEITHSAGDAGQTSDLAKLWNWQTGHWGYLLDKLRSVNEANGTLLSNCMVVFLTEAGGGVEQGAGGGNLNDNFGAHSGNNMIVMLAGRAGGKFVPKGHVDGGGAHPAQVVVSAMRTVGVTGPLGEITQGLPVLG
jgi:hypothetical protein